MKLYVDDLRDPPDDGWTVCRSSGDAVHYLSGGNYSLMSLDHDLGDHDTGDQIIKWMIEQCLDGNYGCVPCEIIIHSANPVGSSNMEFDLFTLARILNEAGNLAVCVTKHGNFIFQWDSHARHGEMDKGTK